MGSDGLGKDPIDAFTEWALSRGVTLNGIAAHRFTGRGVGIIAESKIETGQEILHAPIPVLRTELTAPKNISKSLSAGEKEVSINGLLAVDIALDSSTSLHPSPLPEPWRATLPSQESFLESMPIHWPAALQALLPPEAHRLLTNQQTKFETDWALVSSAFPDEQRLTRDSYLYHWLLVTTRTFFFTSPRIKKRVQRVRDDCLALVPLADLFNHAAVGCEVSFSPAAYSVTADREYQAGEEVCISYGGHGNDFLLAEYGFIMSGAGNKWDGISLDHIMEKLINKEQEGILREEGFWGRYALDGEGLCYRTRVALGLLSMPVAKWRRALSGGFEVQEGSTKRANEILAQALSSESQVVEGKVREVEELDVGLKSCRETLLRRWMQIQKLLDDEINRLQE